MIRAYRKQWLKLHLKYENKARIIFQKEFKRIANTIPYSKMEAGTYKTFTEFYVSKDEIFNAYVKVYTEIGSIHGKRVGKQINKQINQKDFTIDSFLSEFQKTIARWLIQNGGQRITSVRSNYIAFLNQIIAKGISEGKSMPIIASEMQKIIKSRNFYRWQAMRIARTETTTASNYAATVSSGVSGVIMDKVWISALDNRTRRPPHSRFDHYEMNEVKVPLDKPFIVGGEKLMYAGDPKGSAGNTIQCRCTNAQVVRRDKNGNIIRTDRS